MGSTRPEPTTHVDNLDTAHTPHRAGRKGVLSIQHPSPQPLGGHTRTHSGSSGAGWGLYFSSCSPVNACIANPLVQTNEALQLLSQPWVINCAYWRQRPAWVGALGRFPHRSHLHSHHIQHKPLLQRPELYPRAATQPYLGLLLIFKDHILGPWRGKG